MCNCVRRLISIVAFTVFTIPTMASATDKSDTEIYKKEPYAAQKTRSLHAYIRNLRKLNDEGERDKAKTEAIKALSIFGDNESILYEAARAELSTYEATKNIIGYRYTDSAEEKAVNFINRALNLPNASGRPYSLLLHIYAVQGKQALAKQSIADFEASQARDSWFLTNLGTYYLSIHQYDNAFDTFIRATKTSDRRASRNAWQFLTKLRRHDTKYERNNLVNSGLYERVEIQELVNYIKKRKTKKPLFLVLTSDDPACTYCERGKKAWLTKNPKYHNKYDFIVSSVEPWSDIQYLKDIKSTFRVTGIPTSYVIDNSNIIYILNGMANEKYLASMQKKGLLAAKFKRTDRYKEFENLTELALKEFRFARMLSYYSNSKDDRAIAVAMLGEKSKRHYTFGSSWGKASQAEANQEAIQRCETSLKKIAHASKKDVECKLFAQGEKIIATDISRTTFEILQKDLNWRATAEKYRKKNNTTP